MLKQNLVECVGFNGFYPIPNFSRYMINKRGIVVDRNANVQVKGFKSKKGYVHLRLVRDDGALPLVGRHRLMGVVFLEEFRDITKLFINHINGIPGDDRIDNLEWVTPQENSEHSGALGLNPKCIPILVRDVDSGIITSYPSATAYAKLTGCGKDVVLWKTRSEGQRVYKERKQYKTVFCTRPWFIPEDIEAEVAKAGREKTIYVRHVLSEEVFEFELRTHAAEHLGIALPTLTQWTAIDGQPLLPGFVQLKTDPKEPWRGVADPYLEIEAFTKQRCVVVNDLTEAVERIYLSAKECADDCGIKPTALSHRLKSNGKVIYRDNKTYRYYKQS